jgi:hypothetical protein
MNQRPHAGTNQPLIFQEQDRESLSIVHEHTKELRAVTPDHI